MCVRYDTIYYGFIHRVVLQHTRARYRVYTRNPKHKIMPAETVAAPSAVAIVYLTQ